MRSLECGQHKPPDSTTRLQNDSKRTSNRLESGYHRCRIHVRQRRLVRQRDMSKGSAKRVSSWQRLCGGGDQARATLRKEKCGPAWMFQGEDCCNEGKVAGRHLLYIVYRKARPVADYQYSKLWCMSTTLSKEPYQEHLQSHLVDIDNEPKDIRLDTFVIRGNRKPLPIDVGAANSHHSRPVDISLAHSPTPMPRKANGASSRPSKATGSAPSSASSTADDHNMSGNLLEQRRKHASLESPDSATMTANLMSRSSFTLDNAPPPTTPTEAASKGFTDLPEQDKRNFLLLVLLYFLQGIPMGLAAGSVPFLLKSHLSYGQIGVYSLASYPYSLKLLWSPIVDAVWTPRLGRRKSWILPIQTISGLGMIWLGSHVEEMMIKAGENGGAGVWNFTGWWFALVLMCATQDIAVDGMYALKSQQHHY
jgi:hypothetical protein